MATKTTIYLSDELRRTVKKHVVDTEQSLSEYTEAALWAALKNDSTPTSRRRIKELRKIHEFEKIIKKFENQ